MSKASQRGFTLIELVVVIVILGVLAAFAVPRFMGLEVQARVSTVNGLAGAVRSAVSLAHATQLASGLGPNAAITVNGTAVAMSNGYPTVASLPSVLEDTTGFTYTAGVFGKDGAGTPATCSVTYTAATLTGTVVTSPVVAVATGGC
jgi:MSHA pilin protein MshA